MRRQENIYNREGEVAHSVTRIFATTPTDPDYGQLITSAYQFFSLHSDGKYTPASLSELAVGREEFALNNLTWRYPIIQAYETPWAFDEETEVKTGGKIAMLVEWTGRKAMIAVHRDMRRQQIGTRLLRYSDAPHWVGRGNSGGQIFLLNNCYVVTAMNSRGAIRYEPNTVLREETEE